MKSNNWTNLMYLSQLTDMPVRVEYTLSDLFLTESEMIIEDVETVIVVLKNCNQGTYVGVAQTSPKDKYNKVLGREIAAGRALRAWYDDQIESELWELESKKEKVKIYGNIPFGVDISEEILYSPPCDGCYCKQEGK